MVSIWTFPEGYKPHTTYREFGSHTLMLFDTYPEAVNAAMPFTELFGVWKPIPDPKIPWGMGHHTWVLYSDKEAVAGKQYLQILASNKKHIEVPPNFWQFQGKEGWVLLYDERRSAFNSILSMENRPK